MADNAIITGIVAFSSAVLGASVPWVREWLAERRRQRYSAIRIICALDEFVEDCSNKVGRCDDPDADGSWPKPIIYAPAIEWRLIDGSLLYRSLSLPTEITKASALVEEMMHLASTEIHHAHLTEMATRYRPLQAKAETLARDFRLRYHLPANNAT